LSCRPEAGLSDLGEGATQGAAPGIGTGPTFGRRNPEVRDLVAQGVAVNPQAASGAAEVPVVGPQGGDDELPFDLLTRLLEGHPLGDELVDDLRQTSIEILSASHDPFSNGGDSIRSPLPCASRLFLSAYLRSSRSPA